MKNRAGLTHVEDKLKINVENVWIDPKERMQTYIDHKLKHDKDSKALFTHHANHFSVSDDLFITDYLVNKLKDIEPFIVQSLNYVDNKILSLKNHIDLEIKTLNEKTVSFVDAKT